VTNVTKSVFIGVLISFQQYFAWFGFCGRRKRYKKKYIFKVTPCNSNGKALPFLKNLSAHVSAQLLQNTNRTSQTIITKPTPNLRKLQMRNPSFPKSVI